MENSFYFGGHKQIGPNWNPLVCPTVWRGDRGLCEARAAPWVSLIFILVFVFFDHYKIKASLITIQAIFAQEYVSGFYPKETSELYRAGYRYYVDGEYGGSKKYQVFELKGRL